MASLSPTNTSFPPYWASGSNSTSFREASFSSYLSNSEETYIRSLVESSQNQPHSKQQHQNDGLHTSRHQKKVDDGEIHVFSADKYFNGRMEERNNSSIRSNSAKFHALELVEDRTNQEMFRVHSYKQHKVQSRTPSINQSELSSNSQSALLKRFPRTPSRVSSSEGNNNNAKAQGHGMISLLSCSCCVKSVDIEREATTNYHGGGSRGGISIDGRTGLGYSKGVPRSIKTSLDTADITRLNKLRVLDTPDPFVFPSISDSPVGNKVELEVQEDEGRKSLDVFGSSDFDEGSRRFSLQKRLNMLAWDAIPRTITNEEINTSGAPSETYKDTESDASSDLFEIECLSCSANPVNVQGPRVLPSDGCATPTTVYAPSEVSIEWSVVTASAADFSFVSDSEDQRSRALPLVTRNKIASKPISIPKMPSMIHKEVQKPISSNILGCKSQKAVDVAREVHRKSPARGKSESQRMHRLSDSFVPVTRFQAEAKVAGFGQRQRQSSSPDLLYIQ